jgi:hypothetical protein
MVELLMSPEAAAAFVGVSPDVLNVWTEVLGVPRAIPIGNGERLYPVTGLVRVRRTLEAEKSILPAVPRIAPPSLPSAGSDTVDPATPVNVVVVHVGRRQGRKRG